MIYLLTERCSIEDALYLLEMPLGEIREYMKRCKNDEERQDQINKIHKICREIIVGNGEVLREYRPSMSMEYFGRLYSNGLQTIMKEFRGFLLKDTTDLDISNCHPTILSYVCRKHKIECPQLDNYIANRNDVLLSDEKRSSSEVKVALLKSMNSDKVDKNEKNRLIKAFDVEMKRLQKDIGAIEEYEYIFATVPESRDYNIAGSKLNRVLCTYEDNILWNAVEFFQGQGLRVATKMFDGCNVYGNHYDNAELRAQLHDAGELQYPGINLTWTCKDNCGDIYRPENWKSKKLAKILDEKAPLTPEEIAAKAEADNVVGVMDGDDAGAAEVVLKHYPHWVCCEKTLYVYDDTSGIWTDDLNVQNRIISRLEEHLKIVRMTKDGLEYTGKNYARSSHKRRDIYGYINQNTVDNDWALRTESSSLGKVLFKNGHFDFRRQVFVAGRPIVAGDDEENGFNPAIVFAHRVDHDFEPFNDADMEYMATIRGRLFTQALGDEVGDYLIRNIARGFAGDTMKRIMFGLGMTNAGKGMLTKACQMSMGAYCGTFTAENLAFNNNSADEAQKLRWAYLLRHKRLVFSNEVSSRGTLNGDLIKKISSGGVDRLTARLHGGNETSFIPHYLCVVLANDMPKIEPMDGPMQGRARVYTYTKSFVDEPSNEFELKSDPNLTREMETLRFQRCFIGLLVQSYMVFEEAGRVEEEPVEVMAAIKDWIGSKEDNDIMTLFQDKYEITNDPEDFVRGDEIEAWAVKGKQSSYKKFCIELRKHAAIKDLLFVENKNKKAAKKVFKVWSGIRAVLDDSLEEMEVV